MNSLESGSPRRPSAFRNRGRAGRLALKELRETLRDRRTLMTLLLMPILVYPLLGVILQKALLSAIAKPSETVSYSLAFPTPGDEQRFLKLYYQGIKFLDNKIDAENIHVLKLPDVKTALAVEDCFSAGADLVVLFPRPETSPSADGNTPSERMPAVELVYETGNVYSLTLALEMEQALQAAQWENARQRLALRKVSLPFPDRVKATPISLPKAAVKSFSLATFVPLMLILMTVTGAVYPAIDLTAGERERGTLEVLVAAPVPRMELLSAKFVAVLTVAMLTAIVNLIAMLITIHASGLEALVFGEAGLSWVVMGQILALLFLFAAFFSAVLLALTSFARSFKEAQAYLIPLMLVSLAPGVFSLTPGLKMNALLAVTPLVNIVLLGRDLLQGQMVPLLFAGAVVSTILYALFALAVAAKVFGSDAILYGSQGSVKDWFRRPETIRPVPTLTQVMFALAVLFPAFVILGSLPGRFPFLPMSNRLGFSAVLTLLLFAGWPAVMVWRNSVRFASAFRMRKPSGWFFLVAVLWGGSLWLWAYELEILTLSPNRLDVLRDVFEQIKLDLDKVPLAWKLTTLAIVPAMCEEWFFRGYLLAGLRARMTALQAVLASAALFGLFHVVVRDILLFERFLPSGMMGLMLGWLAVRSGSVWPGMLLHVMHNGLLLSIEAHQVQLKAWGIGVQAQQHLPWIWLMGSGVAILAGACVLQKISPSEPVPISPSP